MRWGLLAGAMALAGCQDTAADRGLQKVRWMVGEAEKACGVPPGSVRVLGGPTTDGQWSQIHVFAGCPPNSLYSCLWRFKESHRLSNRDLPIGLVGCHGEGVE